MNIVFYHRHQNGDTFTSRLFVKHFIENTKDRGHEYFYTSENSLESYCDDIGVPNENFNKFKLPDIDEGIVLHKEDKAIFINLWISCSKHSGCIWCLDGYIKHYNDIINDMKEYGVDVKPIDEDTIPFLPIERSREYNIDPKYKKIIIYYNCAIKSYYHLNMVDHSSFISGLATNYPDYLFVTFVDSKLPHENVKSFKEIVKDELPIGYGIDMANFCKVADKVIFLPSGVSQIAFYHEKDKKNKYAIFYYVAHPFLIPDNFICEDRNTEHLCIDKYGHYIRKVWIENRTPMDIFNELRGFISN